MLKTSKFILCVCQYGHSRSVALAREFHKRAIPAVAVGVVTAGPAGEVLMREAAAICLLDYALRGSIPGGYGAKVDSFHVGPDRWVNPYNTELAGILSKMVDEKLAVPAGSEGPLAAAVAEMRVGK